MSRLKALYEVNIFALAKAEEGMLRPKTMLRVHGLRIIYRPQFLPLVTGMRVQVTMSSGVNLCTSRAENIATGI